MAQDNYRLYIQAEAAARAAAEAAATSREILDEQRRANAVLEQQRRAQLMIEAKRLADDRRLQQEKRDHDASSSGDGFSEPAKTASKLGWYYRIYPIQNLKTGTLIVNWEEADNSQGYIRGDTYAFLEGYTLKNGGFYFVAAHSDGSYTYTDNTGLKRIVKRFVVNEFLSNDQIKYHLGSMGSF